MPNKTALVLGASGLIGSLLTDLLLKSPEYSQVTLLLRRKTNRSHAKLRQEVIDFDAPVADKIRGDDVFCCLGTTIKVAGSKEAFYKVDCTYPYEMARLARQNGSSQFLLVTAIGANSKSSIFYNRVKGEVEEKITSLGFPTFCIFRPSLLLGERKEVRMGEKIGGAITKIFSGLMIGGLKKYKPIQASKVAVAMGIIASRNLKGQHVFESDTLQDF
jgi:uncharacterized protein YbjT (DUF2867 family)